MIEAIPVRTVEDPPLQATNAELAGGVLRSRDLALAALARGIALCGREGAPLQDQLDWAEEAASRGFEATSCLLRTTAFIRMGCNRAVTELQDRLVSRSASWKERRSAQPSKEAEGEVKVMRRPLDELHALITSALPARDKVSTEPRLIGWKRQVGAAADPPPPPDAETMLTSSRSLWSALRNHDSSLLEAVLVDLRRELLDRPPIIPADHPDLCLFGLAAAAAASTLRSWLLLVWDLAQPPFGSASLLIAAAHCQADGLGSYFSRVPALLRRPEDLLSMITVAGGSSPAEINRWLVLLSTAFEPEQLEALVLRLKSVELAPAVDGIAKAGQRRGIRRARLYTAARDIALASDDREAAVMHHEAALVIEPESLTPLPIVLRAAEQSTDALQRAFARDPR